MTDQAEAKPLHCGLVMPISNTETYPNGHWSDVKSIITQAVQQIDDHKFTVDLVSSSDSGGVIQKRILEQLYNSDVVVCDVSSKNPNVMLELGMRLAFDKPVVLIKDDRTPFIFDTGPLLHLQYPADLRHNAIEVFKNDLAKAVKALYVKSTNGTDNLSYLQSFGPFQVTKIRTEEVSADVMMLSMLEQMRAEMAAIRANQIASAVQFPPEYSSPGNSLLYLLGKNRAAQATDAPPPPPRTMPQMKQHAARTPEEDFREMLDISHSLPRKEGSIKK